MRNYSWSMPVTNRLLGGSSHLVSGLVHPSYKWTLPPLIPLITRVVTHLLSGMSHQVKYLGLFLLALRVSHVPSPGSWYQWIVPPSTGRSPLLNHWAFQCLIFQEGIEDKSKKFCVVAQNQSGPLLQYQPPGGLYRHCLFAANSVVVPQPDMRDSEKISFTHRHV